MRDSDASDLRASLSVVEHYLVQGEQVKAYRELKVIRESTDDYPGLQHEFRRAAESLVAKNPVKAYKQVQNIRSDIKSRVDGGD